MHAIARSAILLATLLFASPGFAGNILDAADVAAAIGRGAIVWDARDAAAYRQGHLPGAVTVAEADRVLRLPGPQEFNELVRVEKSLGDAGIDLSREIVVYANRGSPVAYAALAAAQYFGARNAAVFHDGIEGWHDSGRAIETGDGRRTPVAVRITPDPRMTVTTEEVLAWLNKAEVQIIDARTSDEYSGRDVRGPRGGHIPGAVNIPYETNWVDPEANIKLARRQVNDTRGMALKSEADLRRLYAGLDPAKETVVYCQTGGRASETFGILKQIGFSKVRLYKPSWAGWAGRADAPVAGGAPSPLP